MRKKVPSLLRVFGMASRLASLRRFSMEGLSHPESVLEHTGFVALASLWLVSELRARGYEVDVGVVLTKALVHDVDELVTGDIPRPTKYSTPKATELFEEIKRTAIDRVTKFLSPHGSFSGVVADFHGSAKEGPSGLIVAIADMLAVVYVVWREVILRGNVTLVRQAVTVRRQLDKVSGRVAAETAGAPRIFLDRVLAEARDVSDAAAARDDPIHAQFWEQDR